MYTRWWSLDPWVVILVTGWSDMHKYLTGLQTHSWLVNCHPTSHSQLSVDFKAASTLSRSQVKRHSLSNYCRDIIVPRCHVRIDTRFSPSFLVFVGARGEPGNEAIPLLGVCGGCDHTCIVSMLLDPLNLLLKFISAFLLHYWAVVYMWQHKCVAVVVAGLFRKVWWKLLESAVSLCDCPSKIIAASGRNCHMLSLHNMCICVTVYWNVKCNAYWISRAVANTHNLRWTRVFNFLGIKIGLTVYQQPIGIHPYGYWLCSINHDLFFFYEFGMDWPWSQCWIDECRTCGRDVWNVHKCKFFSILFYVVVFLHRHVLCCWESSAVWEGTTGI